MLGFGKYKCHTLLGDGLIEARECPECGCTATQEWELDDLSLSLNFPNGHGEITEEGLLRKAITDLDGSTTHVEVGKEGVVISRGESPSERITTLLETILLLGTPEPGDAGVDDFAQASARKWNRKRAKRRFNRWLRVTNNDLPPIKDPRLRDLAERLIPDFHFLSEIAICYNVTKALMDTDLDGVGAVRRWRGGG